MHCVARTWLAAITAGSGLLLCGGDAAFAQQPSQPQPISLDSLLSTTISTASKYAQRSAAAPASVTILSSEDLERFGFRTLQDVFESVRGFYVSNDRNYPYLGARGFSRPSDYNNRILLLVDGHSLNEQTWGGVAVGSDLPLNLDAIERIEIVRGPGSTLYGTNAMFAVINIVTRTVATLDGVIAGARVGSEGLREGTIAAGGTLGKSSSFTMSGLLSRLDGADRYYPEYDSPQTNAGVAHNLDWERAVSGLAALNVRDIDLRVGYYSRSKGIPTGAYESAFNDSRMMTVDEHFWGDVAAMREVSGRLRLTGRLFADRHRYRGVFPTDPGPSYTDGGGSTDVGGEGIAVWDLTSRHRLTLGSEVRHVALAEYYEHTPGVEDTRDNRPTSTLAVFSQDEFQVSPVLTLVGGLRWDWNSRREDALSPRLAVIVMPTSATTIKALYGEAFRAPSAAEADLSTTYYMSNPALRPERIRTFELTVEHRFSAPFLASGSVYSYRMHRLIDQDLLPDGSVTYKNLTKADGAGVELELDFRPDGPVSAHASYAFQRADQQPLGERLTNSPVQVATLAVTARHRRALQLTGLTRYESGRQTLNGASTPAYVRTDANVTWSPAVLRGAQIGVRVTNAFNVLYEVPGAAEHLQNVIPQDGRAWSIRLTRRF
ncbi:MAG: TonB-dependent receptor [Gemmatimonadaceae bacterium]|nr:TonB-dependent receptor [Gemmatimonadaceae bacterium]